MKNPKTWFAVLHATPWGDLTLPGVLGRTPLSAPKDGPSAFIPLFDTRERAVAWLDGRHGNIAKFEAK